MAKNPGITSAIKQYWVERLKVREPTESILIDIKRDRDDLKRPLTLTEKISMTLNDSSQYF